MGPGLRRDDGVVARKLGRRSIVDRGDGLAFVLSCEVNIDDALMCSRVYFLTFEKVVNLVITKP